MLMKNETPKTVYKTQPLHNLCTGAIFEVRDMVCIKTIPIQEAGRTHVYNGLDLSDGRPVTLKSDEEVHVLNYEFTYSLVADSTKKRGSRDA